MNPFSQTLTTTARRPQGFTPQQTQGEYNFQKAQAHAAGDPRMHMKGFDKAGFSRSKGQQGYAAAAAANAYAQQNTAAENVPLQDAVANANLDLQYDAAMDQQSLALARLQEQMRNQQRMFQLQQQGNATGFTGSLLSGLMR